MQRTRQGGPRTALALLVAAAVVTSLMAWAFVNTAAPSANTTEPSAIPASADGTEGARPAGGSRWPPRIEVSSSSVAPELSIVSSVSSVSSTVPVDSRLETANRRRGGPPVNAGPGGQAPPVVSPLPTPSAEIAPDGLPVSGLRCTHDGGTFNCGGCRTDGDCPEGQGCVANRRTRRFECTASECEEDTHCFPGFVCRRANTGATGSATIRRCVPEGQRREGEHCDTLPVSPAGSCREGLVCLQGVCSVPCRVDEPSSCPAGHSCRDSQDGPGCYPDCRELGCPEGQRCKRLGDDSHQCLASVRGDCPESPCGEGERCNMRLFRGHGVFWCARLCNPLVADGCPAGHVCGVGSATVSTCYRQCDPVEPSSCGEGWRCVSVSEDMTQWGCRPAPG